MSKRETKYDARGNVTMNQLNREIVLKISNLESNSKEEFLHIGMIMLYQTLEEVVQEVYGKKEPLDELMKQMKEHVGFKNNKTTKEK